MKDIFVGIVIIIVAFLLIDFFYTEKNTCDKVITGGGTQEYKCGILKKQSDIEIDLFGRFW